jgi:hypothetical protein
LKILSELWAEGKLGFYPLFTFRLGKGGGFHWKKAGEESDS